MSDDWRLKVGLVDDGAAKALTERLEAEKLGEDLEAAAGDRVAVSGEGANVFVYAGDRAQADRAADAIRALAAKHDWDVKLELKRWHPTAEEWKDPDVPLPGRTGPGGGRTGAVLLSPLIRPGTVSTVPYNHYSLLRTIEDIFGLPHLGDAAMPQVRSFGPDVFG